MIFLFDTFNSVLKYLQILIKTTLMMIIVSIQNITFIYTTKTTQYDNNMTVLNSNYHHHHHHLTLHYRLEKYIISTQVVSGTRS